MDEFQFVPPLFVLLCFGLGATMFVSPFLWLYQINKGHTAGTLANDTALNAVRMLFLISFGSAIYNFTNPEANIIGEIVILALMVVFLSIYSLARKRKLLKVYIGECANTLFIMVFTLLFMLVTVLFGLMLTKAMFLVNTMVMLIFTDPLRNAVFITGFIWIVSLFWLSRSYRKKFPDEDKPVQFHNVLWPLAVALLLVLLPLVVEQLSRDGKLEPDPPRNVLRKA